VEIKLFIAFLILVFVILVLYPLLLNRLARINQLLKKARPQTCKRCGRIQCVIWNVSDKLWKEFCEKTRWKENWTICLECFAELIGFVDLGNIDKCVYKRRLWEDE